MAQFMIESALATTQDEIVSPCSNNIAEVFSAGFAKGLLLHSSRRVQVGAVSLPQVDDA
jgi:hypothetical protein